MTTQHQNGGAKNGAAHAGITSPPPDGIAPGLSGGRPGLRGLPYEQQVALLTPGRVDSAILHSLLGHHEPAAGLLEAPEHGKLLEEVIGTPEVTGVLQGLPEPEPEKEPSPPEAAITRLHHGLGWLLIGILIALHRLQNQKSSDPKPEGEGDGGGGEVDQDPPTTPAATPEAPPQVQLPTLPEDPGTTPAPELPVAAGEMARVWGDPHFVGADGGKFDFQGETGKTYNLLSDSGLEFHGRFRGKKGLTFVRKTWIRVKGEGGESEIKFAPNKDKVKVDGEKLAKGQARELADGGTVERKGDDLITSTAEGYRIVQHDKGNHINAEVHSGERGVAADGAMPTGLMGETFDADDEAKDGAKGKGAQGEGALRGNKRDYEVHDRVDADFYLATYRDVGEGAKGQPKPRKFARKHFERHGRREGRTPWWRGGSGEFDEIFYLEAHADVAEAVKKGDFRNGAHHFWMHGRAEGRPSQRA